MTTFLNTGDRNARRITSELVNMEVLTAETSRTPLRLAFPARLASKWMPGLFPRQTGKLIHSDVESIENVLT